MAHANSYQKVDVRTLSIDYYYQRDLVLSWVKSRVSDFNPDLLRAIVVSKRADGTMVVIDGGHRTKLCHLAEHYYIDAQVFEGLSLEEESELFGGLNDNRSVNFAQTFRAGCATKDPNFILPLTAAMEGGFAVAKMGPHQLQQDHLRHLLPLYKRRFGLIQGVSTLYGMAQMYPREVLDSTFESIIAMKAQRPQAALLEGVGAFTDWAFTAKSFDEERWESLVSSVTGEMIQSYVVVVLQVTHSKVGPYYYEACAALYNTAKLGRNVKVGSGLAGLRSRRAPGTWGEYLRLRKLRIEGK